MTIYQVVIIGGGFAGMAAAARLQAQGVRTLVLEAHTKIGGCAGYFRRQGFSFDVGATTLVDFESGGVGGELLDAIGMSPLDGEILPGYRAWLPDRVVNLYRDKAAWSAERERAFGDTPAHRQFWTLLDRLAAVFWDASRKGIKLSLQSISDAAKNIQRIGWKSLPLARYLLWTMGDALRSVGLREQKSLVGLLSMLIEDTVHSTVDRAPLINAALGITIRAAGLTRHRGGMRGFWDAFAAHYRRLGGDLRVGYTVTGITGRQGAYSIHAERAGGEPFVFYADQVICALPIQAVVSIAPPDVRDHLQPYLERDEKSLGGAIAVYLGVPEDEVSGQAFTHHQLMQDYDAPLGNGNNMFISVSAPDDTLSAPAGYRAVMISTHCNLNEWENLSDAEYEARKQGIGDCLIEYARRVYPNLARKPFVYEIATPRTYEHFTRRPRGAVGGVHQTRTNSNQFAVPHDIGVPGFWMTGDTTFPGLGTVACVLGSRIVTDYALNAI